MLAPSSSSCSSSSAPSRRHLVPATTTAAVLLLLAAACESEPTGPSLVQDLRVLAIKAEPPELLFDRGTDASGATTVSAAGPVRFEALVMDPRGTPMSYEWSFCPLDSNQTCGDFAVRRDHAAAADRPVLDAARAQATAGEVSPPDGGMGAVALGTFVADVSPALFSYHLADSGLGMGNGAWVSAVLALGSAGERLDAQKRLVLNARDLSQWNPELAAAGWQICPPAPQAQPAGCLPLAPRTANRNPVIEGVEVAHHWRLAGDSGFTAVDPAAGPIVVAPGEVIRLRPRLAADSAERYQELSSNLQNNRLEVIERSEEPIVSWFATAGELAEDQTAPQLSKNLDNSFTAPEVPPAAGGGRVVVFMVVRDQRGGAGWARVDLLVTAP
jgi:hypothetical protein